jgi:hypothetical protein
VAEKLAQGCKANPAPGGRPILESLESCEIIQKGHTPATAIQYFTFCKTSPEDLFCPHQRSGPLGPMNEWSNS